MYYICNEYLIYSFHFTRTCYFFHTARDSTVLYKTSLWQGKEFFRETQKRLRSGEARANCRDADRQVARSSGSWPGQTASRLTSPTVYLLSRDYFSLLISNTGRPASRLLLTTLLQDAHNHNTL